MNREETALACVMALASQRRPPDLVVVADNVSSDATVSTLRALPDLPFALRVIEMDENRGNAGGVEAAMEFAFQEDSDAVWILDDDSWPRYDALAEMLVKDWDHEVVRHAMQIDPKSGTFTWPLQVTDGQGGWKLVGRMEDMPPGEFVRSRIIWTGALVPRRVWERTGPVNGSLFIRGEDEEYPWRIETAGFSQEAVRKALLDHPGPDDLVHWAFAGKNLYFERGLADWKLYYKVRNMVWLKRKQSGTLRAGMMGIAYASVVALLDGPYRLALVMEAILDGWDGRLGRWKKHT